MKRNLAVYALGAGLLAAAAGASAQSALEPTARAMLAGHVACGSSASYIGVQRRVLEHAAQGVDRLRQYVFITRGIYQLNMNEIGEWMDDWREAQSHCTVSLAQNRKR